MKQLVDRYAPLVIIVAAACVTVPRLAALFVLVEPEFMGVKTAWITGPGYGVLAMASTTYVLHTYQQRKRLKNARWLLWGLAVVLGIATVLLMPAMVVQLRQSVLAAVLPPPLDVLFCVLFALSVDILVAVSALAMSMKPGESKPRVQPKRKPTLKCPRCGASSGKDGKPWTKKTQVSGHMKWCKQKEE